MNVLKSKVTYTLSTMNLLKLILLQTSRRVKMEREKCKMHGQNIHHDNYYLHQGGYVMSLLHKNY